MTSPWSDNEDLSAADMYARITVPINTLIAANADTGWVTATSLSSGWTMDSTPLQVRRIGPIVYVIGGLVNSSFNSTSMTTVASIPSMTPAVRPATTVIGSIGGTTGANRNFRLLTDGSVQVQTGAATGVAYRLDNCNYVVG